MPRISLDQIIVIDLECTCWDDEHGNYNRPDKQKSEIIEIGVAAIDTKKEEITETESIMVRPISSTVSKFCTKLTGHTQKDVEQGISLEDACKILKKKYKVNNRVWASWGDYDRVQFDRDCSYKLVKVPFNRRHINAKTLFALRNRLDFELPVGLALEKLNMSFEGRQHRGVDDAKNIARILLETL